jgi:alanine dehydrogenase
MIYPPLKTTSFVVREFLLKVNKTHSALTIGVPKENTRFEKRLALTPEAVAILVDEGHKVIVEAGAGSSINYSDNYYSESGAYIVDSPAEVFEASLILKISPPTLQEVRMMRPRATVFSFLQQPMLSATVLEAMSAKRINALAYDLVYEQDGTSPFATAMSEIEGASAVTLAAELMSNANGGKGILMGGVPGVSPTEVVIVGAEVAGTIAARSALGLGAMVKVFDNDISKLRLMEHNLGRTLFTSTLQPNVMRNSFRSADVLIGAMEYINKPHRDRISADLIRELKHGAIVIDLRLAQGGCFETTMEACIPGAPTMFEKHGVLHICEMSISSRVARTSSIAMSNIFASLFLKMASGGGLVGLAQSDRGFSSGFYMFSGKMVNAYVANLFNFSVNDIGLFLPGY